MTLKNNKLLGIIVTLIVLAVYNVLIFILVDTKDRMFFVSYAFTLVALVLPLIIQIAQYPKQQTPKSVFLNLPLYPILFVYLIVQLIAGTGLMFLPDEQYKVSLIVQIVILAIFAILMISTVFVKNVAEDFEGHVAEKRFYLKSLEVDVSGMADRTDDALLKKNLKNLADAFKYSDPMSDDSLAPLENKIAGLVAELENAVASNPDMAPQKIKDVELALTERNRKAKLLK